MNYDAEWDRFSKWIGANRQRIVKPPKIHNVKENRYLIISDLHIPFQNDKAILEAIDTGVSEKCQTLIIGGDMMDLYSLSKYSQYVEVPIKEEFIAARKLLDWVTREFEHVIVLEGNHEARERKHFARKLTPAEQGWLLGQSLLQRVTRDMPNLELVSNKFFDSNVSWWCQIGYDAIIGHPEVSSKVPLKPVSQFLEWSHNWNEVLGFNKPKLIIIGHTHNSGVAWVGDTMLVENGCLCRIQGYALESKLYSKPQRLAYTIFHQNQAGKTDRQSVRQYYPFC